MIQEHLDCWKDKDGNVVYGDKSKYNEKLEYLMSNNPEEVVSCAGLLLRKAINPIYRGIIRPLSTKNKFEILKPYELQKDSENLSVKDKFLLNKGLKIPKGRPVIFAATHGFRDDIALTIKSAKKHGYILYGSIPDFFYSIDGPALWLNGATLVDRKDKESRAAAVPKMEYILNIGGRIIMFPEGVWNKSPNKLVLKLYPGIYRLAKATNAIIIPIANIQVDDKCYSVRLAPFDIIKYSEEEGLANLRDILATGKYELMEKYAFTSRQEIGNANEYWDNFLNNLIATSNGLYDYEIENNAEYKDKDEIDEKEVFEVMRNVKVDTGNAFVYAKTLGAYAA